MYDAIRDQSGPVTVAVARIVVNTPECITFIQHWSLITNCVRNILKDSVTLDHYYWIFNAKWMNFFELFPLHLYSARTIAG